MIASTCNRRIPHMSQRNPVQRARRIGIGIGGRVVLVGLLISFGCDAPAELWSGRIEALPDGRKRVTNPAQGVWETGQAWQLVQDLAIGEVEGDDATVFGSISGLEVDDAGRIYVLDRQANELRIFAPDGSHLRTVGRKGSAPGEYTAANGLLWLAPDSLLIIDQQAERFTVLTKDGDYVRSENRFLGFFGWTANAGHLDGRVYETSSVERNDVTIPALLGTMVQGGQVHVAGAGSSDTEKASGNLLPYRDTILLPESGRPVYQGFSVRTSRGGMGMSVPFAPRTIYHLDYAGNLWHGHGSEFRIFRSRLSGDTTLEITVAAQPIAVTPEELHEWEAGESVKRFRAMGGQLDMGRIPSTKPYFERFYLDPEGFLWVTIPSGPNTTVFGVFDQEGRYLGRLELPGIRADVWVPPVVRNGHLYVSGRDALDVPRVFRYRTDRD